eukprot:Lithocolla_globosa_v1_NODE_4524_length_1417_cov_15.572687.p3 type:complete len:128 gc:universal NODE_4524_length_1417_cov_15.572687:92-475(+)
MCTFLSWVCEENASRDARFFGCLAHGISNQPFFAFRCSLCKNVASQTSSDGQDRGPSPTQETPKSTRFNSCVNDRVEMWQFLSSLGLVQFVLHGILEVFHIPRIHSIDQHGGPTNVINSILAWDLIR